MAPGEWHGVEDLGSEAAQVGVASLEEREVTERSADSLLGRPVGGPEPLQADLFRSRRPTALSGTWGSRRISRRSSRSRSRSS